MISQRRQNVSKLLVWATVEISKRVFASQKHTGESGKAKIREVCADQLSCNEKLIRQGAATINRLIAHRKNDPQPFREVNFISQFFKLKWHVWWLISNGRFTMLLSLVTVNRICLGLDCWSDKKTPQANFPLFFWHFTNNIEKIISRFIDITKNTKVVIEQKRMKSNKILVCIFSERILVL